jgi:hypothetical protein
LLLIIQLYSDFDFRAAGDIVCGSHSSKSARSQN